MPHYYDYHPPLRPSASQIEGLFTITTDSFTYFGSCYSCFRLLLLWCSVSSALPLIAGVYGLQTPSRPPLPPPSPAYRLPGDSTSIRCRLLRVDSICFFFFFFLNSSSLCPGFFFPFILFSSDDYRCCCCCCHPVFTWIRDTPAERPSAILPTSVRTQPPLPLLRRLVCSLFQNQIRINYGPYDSLGISRRTRSLGWLTLLMVARESL